MGQAQRSNRLEVLADGLAEVVEAPLSSPFARETILVPSRALGAWLATELAKRHGVWANPDFRTARAFVEADAVGRGDAAEAAQEEAGAAPFEPAALAWSIAATLPAHLEDAAFAEVRRYLEGDADGTKRLALAGRIARAFDRYVLHRPELIAAWERGEDAHWQAKLFRALVAKHGATHLAARVDRLVANKQAEEVQGALRRVGIPTVLESEASVFESAEAGELEQVLRAVLEPTRTTVLRSALATSIVGLSAEGIVALEADERGWQAWSERFRVIQDVWATRGFMPAYRRLLRDLGVEPRLLSYVDGERRVRNLLHLGDLLHAASRRERLRLSGIVRWLGAMRAAPHAKGHHPRRETLKSLSDRDLRADLAELEKASEGAIAVKDLDARITLPELGRPPSDDELEASRALRPRSYDRKVDRSSRAVRHGHVCLDLARVAREGVPLASPQPLPQAQPLPLPALDEWLAALGTSRVVGGGGADVTPLVLDGERLYLRRYFRYETRLAEQLGRRIAHLDTTLDVKALRAILDRLFPRTGLAHGELDLQRLTALVAVARRFCIISGGPGTGKTTTVVKILALLAEQALLGGRKKLHVTLVAPTGKAAARLREAILAERAKLDVEEHIRAIVPDATSTSHRALKPIAGTLSRSQHHADSPLPTDVLLVDEASMVDRALMARLVDALPPHARLILLGDRNQLASVEAGAVFGDLCGPARAVGFSRAFAAHVGKLTGDELPVAGDGDGHGDGEGLGDCVVQLRRNYRYPAGSGIAALAQAINDGDADGVLAVLAAGYEDVKHFPAPAGKDGLGEALRACVVAGYGAYLREREPRACFEAFGRFRVLAPHRRGALGVERLNVAIEEALAGEGVLQASGAWYARRPVMARENDYQVGLFNGDVGLVWPDAEDGDAARVWFFGAEGPVRRLAPSRLPAHETVFAMTVHKAQGSEFEEVAVVLPREVAAVLTRELLYTAVTRARRAVAIAGEQKGIASAVRRPIWRTSGLRESLGTRALRRTS